MNWTPDRPIDYIDADTLPGMTVMIQSNYSHSYKFWTFPDDGGKYDHHDVAIWRLKSLKSLP